MISFKGFEARSVIGSTTTVPITVPAETSNGDFLLVWIVLNTSDPLIVRPSSGGWNFAGGTTRENRHRFHLYWKVADNEPNEMESRLTSEATAALSGCTAYSGVNRDDPFIYRTVHSEKQSAREMALRSFSGQPGTLVTIRNQTAASTYSGDDVLRGQHQASDRVQDYPVSTAIFERELTEAGTVTTAPSYSTIGGQAALVVSSPNSLNAGDQEWVNQLQAAGFSVELQAAFRSGAEKVALAENSNLSIVSASVSSGQIGAQLKDADVGVVLAENFIADDMGLTDTPQNGSLTDLEIRNAASPITEGFSTATRLAISDTDPVPVGLINEPIAPGAVALATGFGSAHAIAVIDDGKELLDGTLTPARRSLGLIADDPANLNANGQLLLGRIIDWTARYRVSPETLGIYILREAPPSVPHTVEPTTDILTKTTKVATIGVGQQADTTALTSSSSTSYTSPPTAVFSAPPQRADLLFKNSAAAANTTTTASTANTLDTASPPGAATTSISSLSEPLALSTISVSGAQVASGRTRSSRKQLTARAAGQPQTSTANTADTTTHQLDLVETQGITTAGAAQLNQGDALALDLPPTVYQAIAVGQVQHGIISMAAIPGSTQLNVDIPQLPLPSITAYWLAPTTTGTAAAGGAAAHHSAFSTSATTDYKIQAFITPSRHVPKLAPWNENHSIQVRQPVLELLVRIEIEGLSQMDIIQRADIIAGETCKLYLVPKVVDQILLPPATVVVAIADGLMNPVIPAMPASWDEALEEWVVIFSAEQTMLLLKDPLIPTGELRDLVVWGVVRSSSPDATFDLIRCSVGKTPIPRL